MKLKNIIVAILLVLAIFLYFKPRTVESKPILPQELVDQVIAKSTSPDIKAVPKMIDGDEIDITSKSTIDAIAEYIKEKEGFKSHAYPDHHQYTIGYGTAATSPDEVITREEAETRLYDHINKVIIPTFESVNFKSIDQVYAAIDFAYNLGHNCFLQKIVDASGYMDCEKIMSYNKVRNSDGELVYNEALAQRRLENFLNCASYEVVENTN